MKTRTIATLTALTLSAFAGTAALAGDSAVTVGTTDGIEVIVVTAKRPATLITDEAPAIATAAGAVADEAIEVIVVTASRSEALAAMRAEARERWLDRAAAGPRYGVRNYYWFGMPAR
jgi:hypothetical protein